MYVCMYVCMHACMYVGQPVDIALQKLIHYGSGRKHGRGHGRGHGHAFCMEHCRAELSPLYRLLCLTVVVGFNSSSASRGRGWPYK